MEESQVGMSQSDLMFVTGINDHGIIGGSSWASNEFHAGLMCSVNIVPEREKKHPSSERHPSTSRSIPLARLQ